MSASPPATTSPTTAGARTPTKATDAYLNELNSAQESFSASIQSLAGALRSSHSLEAYRATLTRFSRSLTILLVRLDAIRTPAAVKVLHQHLIDELKAYTRLLTGALRNNSPGDLTASRGALFAQTRLAAVQIGATLDSIDQALSQHG
jgi:hypothetical protein